jgi:sodium/bile acid cotransporter 7
LELVSAESHSLKLIKKYWFLSGLLAVCILTLADGEGILSASGSWLEQHHGPDLVIVSIFLFSGFALSTKQLVDGLMDVRGILLASVIIFIAAPLLAALFGLIPMDSGIIIGLFLVSVMPSTLSSGVVMTGAAGGNAAHALVTTIFANSV